MLNNLASSKSCGSPSSSIQMNGYFQPIQRQEVEENANFQAAGSTVMLENCIESSVDTAWLKYNILSLDGGGVRGYWSLLVLEKLMDCIGEKEEEDEAIYHSFYPQPWPRDVSQVPLTDSEKSRMDELDGGDREKDRCKIIPRQRRYLPCHYFDNICGSSTGALIAIMLGRFRMTVPDCIYEYEKLGQKVFGNPRIFTPLNFGVGNRHKYDAAALETVIKGVTRRRNERPNGDTFGKITFPTRRGLCTTFVTTKKSQSNGALGTPYIIRSYDHDEQRSPDQSSRPSPRSTFGPSRASTGLTTDLGVGAKKIGRSRSSKINYEKAQEFEIWQVARAATAAPFFFEPLKIQRAKIGGHILFTDGGFGSANNPTQSGKREIEDLHGRNSTGIIVSVGTARGRQEKGPGFFKRIPRAMKNMAYELSDPETVHEAMIVDHDSQHSPYYRLNNPGGLDIELDRWEPKQRWLSKDCGLKTITVIKNSFNEWAARNDTHRQFKECAAALVECRRKRMDTAKWERYATGARYRCRFRGCGSLLDFSDSEKIREHLEQEHGMEDENKVTDQVNECRDNSWRYQAASTTQDD